MQGYFQKEDLFKEVFLKALSIPLESEEKKNIYSVSVTWQSIQSTDGLNEKQKMNRNVEEQLRAGNIMELSHSMFAWI